MFRIRDILVGIWMLIRILGSVPLTNGSGCGSDSGPRDADPASDPALFVWSVTFKMPTKNKFLCLFLLKVHLHNSSKIKIKKKLQSRRNQDLSSLFCLLMEGSGFGSKQIDYGSWCGSRRLKNIRILRIRTRNTANYTSCSARDWDGKDYLRIIPRVVW